MSKLGSKQPYEEYYVSFDFTNVIGSATVASATVIVTDPDGDDVTSTLTDVGQQTITSPLVYIWIKGGDSDKEYKVTCRITTDAGEKYEKDADLPVAEI